MSSPRLRRLRLDHERLQARFRNWSPVQIMGHAGIPPEQYHVTYRLKGLFASLDGRVTDRDEHVAEINLSLGYPRRAPQCKMLTPRSEEHTPELQSPYNLVCRLLLDKRAVVSYIYCRGGFRHLRPTSAPTPHRA